MNLSGYILHRLLGWTADDTLPHRDKCIICVAPHTSNWDFFIGQLYYRSIGRRAGFLMKKEWFFWPLSMLFRSLGGIPINRGHKSCMTDALAHQAQEATHFSLAITPEGTRKLAPRWKHGFYYIALKAGIPIQCYALDFQQKRIIGKLEIQPTGDAETDLKIIMDYYRPIQGRHPSQFAVEEI